MDQDRLYQDIPQIKTSPYASPMHQFGSSIIVLTNPENELYKLELTLRGLKINSEGNPEVAGEPLMNDYGVSNMYAIASSFINQPTVMSNLNKYEVPMLMKFLYDTLIRDLMQNRIAYGIKKSDVRDKILLSILANSFIILKRAFEEGDKRFWKGSVQEITSRIEAAQKKSWLSSLNIWQKK